MTRFMSENVSCEFETCASRGVTPCFFGDIMSTRKKVITSPKLSFNLRENFPKVVRKSNSLKIENSYGAHISPDI